MKTVGFFIGSGCSIPSGQPTTSQLTDDVLKSEMYLCEGLDAYFHTEDSYPRWGSKSDLGPDLSWKPARKLRPWRQPALSIQKFLSELAVQPWWSSKATYEDLSGLLRVIAGTLFGRLNDPLVHLFLERTDLEARVRNLEFPRHHRFLSYDLNRQLTIIDDFIGWVIAKRIRLRPKLVGYDALLSALTWLRQEGHVVHFVTTNYDCNIERLLRKSRVQYDDGFAGEPVTDGQGRRWRLGAKVRFRGDNSWSVVKLHGSVNWYYCQDTHNLGWTAIAVSDIYADPTDAYLTVLKGATGASLYPYHFKPRRSPETMRGALSKSFEYSYGIYSELLAAFEEVLRRADIMVVAGCGWSDEAVAQRLIRFAHTENKRLLLFDGTRPPAIKSNKTLSDRLVGKIGPGQRIDLCSSHLSSLKPRQLLSTLRSVLK